MERAGRAQLFELLQQAKQYAAAQPQEAAQLLIAKPQVYCALQLAMDRLAGPHWPPPAHAGSRQPPSTDAVKGEAGGAEGAGGDATGEGEASAAAVDAAVVVKTEAGPEA